MTAPHEAGRAGVLRACRQMWTALARFDSPDQERDFLRAYCRDFSVHRRLALGLAVVTLSLNLALDLFIGEDLEAGNVVAQVIGTRIAMIALMALCLGLASAGRFARDERYASLVLVAAVLPGFLLYCRAFLLAPYPYDYMYFFMGMCIDVVFGFAMLRLRGRIVLAQTALCVAAAAITFAWNWHLNAASLGAHVARIYQVSAMSLLLSISMIGCVVANLLERNARDGFAQRRALAGTNERLVGRSGEVGRLNRALRAAVDRAERESAARGRVLASASHDLRQPLHALSVYSAVLAAEPTPGTLLEVGRHIDQISRSLGALLHGLLDLSQLSSGHYVPVRRSARLDELCRRLCSEFDAAARAKGLRLECRAEPMCWTGDTVAFSRIVRNLIDNAIKYTASGRVSLGLAREGGVAVLEVEDSGEGIHPDALPRIFEEFFQVGNHGRDRNQGVGLGLAIVHRLVELAGGGIEARSRPGEGSCFTVRLPVACEGAVAGRAEGLVRGEGGVSGAAGPLMSGARIYVVDDEADILQGMSLLLRSWGCETSTAQRVDEALALFAQQGPPDLMIVDLRLSGPESGVDLVRRLQAAHGAFPVLVATGETASGALRGAREAGWPLLHKPIEGELLREAVRAGLAGGAAPDAKPHRRTPKPPIRPTR